MASIKAAESKSEIIKARREAVKSKSEREIITATKAAVKSNRTKPGGPTVCGGEMGETWQGLQGNVMHDLVIRPLQEGGVDGAEGDHALRRQPSCESDGVLFAQHPQSMRFTNIFIYPPLKQTLHCMFKCKTMMLTGKIISFICLSHDTFSFFDTGLFFTGVTSLVFKHWLS